MTDSRYSTVSAEDRAIMGTPEAAKAALIEKSREWRRLRQPSMDTAAGHRKVEAQEREVRFQLANAALLWLWHEENPEPCDAAQAAPDSGDIDPAELARINAWIASIGRITPEIRQRILDAVDRYDKCRNDRPLIYTMHHDDPLTVGDLRSIAIALKDETAPQPLGVAYTAPDGFVLVPTEPTPEMRAAFHKANAEHEEAGVGWSPDHQWQAMLSSLPSTNGGSAAK